MKHILLLICMASFSIQTFAQEQIVRGNVKDDLGGIIGATVVELDKDERIVKGTITDIDGNYTIKVSSPDVTLQFSFIGYKTVVEKVKGRSKIDVKLSSSDVQLQEVVITAAAGPPSVTGVNMRDQTGASAVVKLDAVQSSVVTSVGDALQAQVAGLDIMSGGSPGSGASITIRGLGSLGGSNPLVVVDGIIQRVSTSDLDFASADQEDIGMLVSIAPEDIKSVRVLKDAAETAIYGTRGANGVLEIETLKGIRGKTKFDFSYKKSLSYEPPRIPMLNGDEYVMLQQEMFHNREGVVDLPSEIANDINFLDYYNYAQNTDWVDDITQLGQIDDIGFKLQGGGDKTKYFASVNYQNNIGTVKNTANKRFTTRINLDYKISKKLNLTTAINYVNTYRDDNWSREGNVRSVAYTKSPNMAIYRHTSTGLRTNEFFTPMENYQGDGVENFNPSAVVAFSDKDQAGNNFQTNFTLRYNAKRWLTIREVVSFQFQKSKRSEFLPYTAIGATWLNTSNNSSLERNSTGTTVNSQTKFNFRAVNNKRHALNGMLMMDITQDNDEYIQTASGGGPSTAITDPASSPLISSLTSNATVVNTIGFLANVHYKLYDRHIFQANMRSDASSRFGASSRWGSFPSVSYAWRFSSEPFLDNWEWLDDSKVRASYGLSGNSRVGAYDRHALYAGSGNYMNLQTVVPTQAQLQRLQWETSALLNVGVDINLFDYRVNIVAEYYDKVTENILWPSYKLPSSAGFSTLKQFNDGKIQNSGYEFTTNVTAIKRKNFNVRFNFNISANKNKFLEFPSNIVDEQTDITNGSYPVKAEIGTPVGSFFGFRYLGVYPTTADAVAHNEDGTVKLDAYGKPIPMYYGGQSTYQFEGGDAMYEDINHDGIIDINDVVYLGDSNPDFAGGFGMNVKYYGFQLGAQFMYRYGYKIVNMVALNAESMSNKDNQSTAVLNRWRVSGDNFPNMIPRAYQEHPANNLGSDRYVEDASYLRLNNLSLNYTFDRQLVKKFNLRNLRVGIQARKLFTWTNYSGQDPEVPMTQDAGNPLWFGKDRGKVPSPIVTAINITAGF